MLIRNFPPKEIQYFINGKKDEGIRSINVKPYDPTQKELMKFMVSMKSNVKEKGLLTFQNYF